MGPGLAQGREGCPLVWHEEHDLPFRERASLCNNWHPNHIPFLSRKTQKALLGGERNCLPFPQGQPEPEPACRTGLGGGSPLPRVLHPESPAPGLVPRTRPPPASLEKTLRCRTGEQAGHQRSRQTSSLEGKSGCAALGHPEGEGAVVSIPSSALQGLASLPAPVI